MTEVVHPLDGDAVALRPCPAWCTLDRHFAEGEVIYVGHGFHHLGAEIEVPTLYPFLGMADGAATVMRAVLKSWTHPLGADPGPVFIELNLGTAAERTGMYAEVTATEAEAVARALLDLAATAGRGTPTVDGVKEESS